MASSSTNTELTKKEEPSTKRSSSSSSGAEMEVENNRPRANPYNECDWCSKRYLLGNGVVAQGKDEKFLFCGQECYNKHIVTGVTDLSDTSGEEDEEEGSSDDTYANQPDIVPDEDY
jgi:hypothetical protein